MRIPTQKEYERILRGGLLFDYQIRAIRALYRFRNHTATAAQLARKLKYKNLIGANGAIGNAGKLIALDLRLVPPPNINGEPAWFFLIATSKPSPLGYVWIMRPELVAALEKTGLAGPGTDSVIFEDETLLSDEDLREGGGVRIEVNAYKRNQAARDLCVAHYGAACTACGFDFASTYGKIGEDFIHVHHIVPMAKGKRIRKVDPIRDLRPVCPNCHAMIHNQDPPLTIEKLKRVLKRNSRARG